MKQNMKKLWITLCMVVCLFALSGCSQADDVQEEIDPNIVATMQQAAEQYLVLFSEMTDEDLVAGLAASAKNKDYVMETAFKSWESVKDDLGAYVSSETAEVTLGDDGYIARIAAVFEQRNMVFTFMVDEELSGPQGISFAPEYTLAENMTKAGMNTLMGMGVVFIVLIFIAWVISLFKYINVFENKMKAKNAPAPAAPAPAAAPAPVAAPVVEEEEYVDDTELISVIAAAIAASEGKTSANGLVVRSIKRVPNRSWK